jgi:transposase
MARPYSQDLRQRVVDAVLAGMSRNAAAKRFAVSISFVVKLVQRWAAQGTVAPGQMGGWKQPALAPHKERVLALVAERNDATLQELCTALAGEGIAVGVSALSRYLRATGLTRKKRLPTPPSRHAPMSPQPASAGARTSPT